MIDLAGAWVMPGFIDAHVHFGDIAAARTALLTGSTTVRTMHVEHFLDVQIRDAHRRGDETLPDVIAAGYQIRPDMFPEFFEDFPALADMKTRVSGADNIRRVVRAMASRRVDHIKFLATERAGTRRRIHASERSLTRRSRRSLMRRADSDCLPLRTRMGMKAPTPPSLRVCGHSSTGRGSAMPPSMR